MKIIQVRCIDPAYGLVLGKIYRMIRERRVNVALLYDVIDSHGNEHHGILARRFVKINQYSNEEEIENDNQG
jgi:hypothetical protein